MTSDANGNMPVFNAAGEVIGLEVQQVIHLYNEVRDLVREERLPVDAAILPVTKNVAHYFRLRNKGAVSVGKDADLLLVEPDLTLRSVYAHGHLMVRDGELLVRGVYE
jgi:beta-aspartyl-dipeptidase (metallo-type)